MSLVAFYAVPLDLTTLPCSEEQCIVRLHNTTLHQLTTIISTKLNDIVYAINRFEYTHTEVQRKH